MVEGLITGGTPEKLSYFMDTALNQNGFCDSSGSTTTLRLVTVSETLDRLTGGAIVIHP
jgi:hypothetical protein